MSITVKSDLISDLELCMPGDLLIKTLNSFNAADVACNHGEHEMLLQSGRSKVTLPCLPADEFKLPNVKGERLATIEMDDDMLEGIRMCLNAVGTDPTHPAQMGVTIAAVNGKAVFYSTDNTTISRYRSKSALKLPGDSPIILPTRFCQQLLAMSKAYPDDNIDLQVLPGALRVKFAEKASLMHKQLVELEPMEFEGVIGKYFDIASVTSQGGYSSIPNAFDAAFNRAMMVQSDTPDKKTEVTVGKDCILIISTSKMANADDEIPWEGDFKLPKAFNVDPSHVVRGLKICEAVAFHRQAMLMGSKDGKFLHLISHVS